MHKSKISKKNYNLINIDFFVFVTLLYKKMAIFTLEKYVPSSSPYVKEGEEWKCVFETDSGKAMVDEIIRMNDKINELFLTINHHKCQNFFKFHWENGKICVQHHDMGSGNFLGDEAVIKLFAQIVELE